MKDKGKHTFLTKTGAVVKFDRFMQCPALHEGHEWRNAHDCVWVEQPVQPVPDDTKLFGYDKSAFMQRQYKPAMGQPRG